MNARHLSLMGSITAPGRLLRHDLPEAALRLLEDDHPGPPVVADYVEPGAGPRSH